jgi:hypothetical protein
VLGTWDLERVDGKLPAALRAAFDDEDSFVARPR